MQESLISIDADSLARFEAAFRGKREAIRKATEAGLKRAGGLVRNEMAREVARAAGIKVATAKRKYVWIRRRLLDVKAFRLIFPSKGLSLFDWHAKQTKTGVVYRGIGGRSAIPHAFIRRGPWGRAVFLRKGRERLPIAAQRGPKISDLMRPRIGEIRRRAAEILKRECERRISWALRQRFANA